MKRVGTVPTRFFHFVQAFGESQKSFDLFSVRFYYPEVI